MEDKQLMLDFIFERQEKEFERLAVKYPKIQRVISIENKEYDDDNGPEGKHYIVKCQMIDMITPSGLTTGPGRFEQTENTCLVDKKEYMKFVNRKKAVIWL